MRSSLLLLAALTLAPLSHAETPAPQTPTAPEKPAAAPAEQPKRGASALTADEQRQLRNARAKANKIPEIAAELKAENEAYRLAKEAKDAKKPKAEVDALYAKARDLRVAREAKRDAAILAANPELKPLVDKAARTERAEASRGKDGEDGKPGEDGKDGARGKDGEKGKDGKSA
jgi:hypothetical protein